MLAKFVDKIAELRKTETFEINGDTYSTDQLHRVDPHVDRPTVFTVSGLDSICKLIREEGKNYDCPMIISVNDYRSVSVHTALLGDLSRDKLYQATADVPGFREGYRGAEEMIIMLRSLFHPSADVDYLLDILSRIDMENGVTTTDNGVSQTVTAKQGVSLKESITLRPRVELKPFRTFLEVEQPESEFILRVNEHGNIGLFEADGGVWKLEAKRSIAAFFEKELADLIEANTVIVMY